MKTQKKNMLKHDRCGETAAYHVAATARILVSTCDRESSIDARDHCWVPVMEWEEKDLDRKGLVSK